MGHREDLLEGAKRCLHEKGYARTTARDLVETSGTNLGSIGYHYGSKEALLDAALIEAVTEMGHQLHESSKDRHAVGDIGGVFERMIAEFPVYRPLLIAQVEAWAQIERSSRLHEKLAKFYEEERQRGIALITATFDNVPEEVARAAASVSLMLGDGIILQWLMDPERAPTGKEIAMGLRAIADTLDDHGPGDAPGDLPQ